MGLRQSILRDTVVDAVAEDSRLRAQVTMSPYYGKPDFSALAGDAASRGPIDAVSVADILRNAFVYPPHSIFEDTKLVTFGFNPDADMRATPEFHFKFRDAGKHPGSGQQAQDWVGTWHRLLRDAVDCSCAEMRSPWLLQSGGKDSTTLAIAVADARPDTTCLTYLGGREEDEVASARFVARTLGLRHEALVCDPGRAYDRYLAIVHRMPLLTADFALLSYIDLATEVAAGGGDGVIDGLGSDSYFGTPVSRQQRLLSWMARGIRLPRFTAELPLVDRNFELCFLLGTLQMNAIERVFPGSRFTDAEVDELFGRDIARISRQRLALFEAEIASATSRDERRDISTSIAGSAGAFAKGLYATSALSMHAAYPFCDRRLRDWVYNEVPREWMVDPATRTNKMLVRKHIATKFGALPYVGRKGSFRFDLCGLARDRFDQVHDQACRARDFLPGAARWLERNRGRLDNKYHASKFYLLAVVLPWIGRRADGTRLA
jgi:asparagine synthetase B (glutamine-hydrolysing)